MNATMAARQFEPVKCDKIKRTGCIDIASRQRAPPEIDSNLLLFPFSSLKDYKFLLFIEDSATYYKHTSFLNKKNRQNTQSFFL